MFFMCVCMWMGVYIYICMAIHKLIYIERDRDNLWEVEKIHKHP